MADLNGYVKLYRQMIRWGWYRDISVKVLFLHCLLMANYQQADWCGITIQRGSFVTSIEELSQQTGLTVQNTRTALKKLTSTGEITKTSTNRYTVITVVNYEKFQNAEKNITGKSTGNSTNNQQTANKQQTGKLTTNEENKEKKNNKEYIEVEEGVSSDCRKQLKELYPDMDWDAYDNEDFIIRPVNSYSGRKVVMLSVVQEDILLNELGTVETFEYYISKLADFIISKNANIKNHFATILKWSKEDEGV